MKQFDKRMNVLNGGKKNIVDVILSGSFDTVVDLGCGQCVIEKALIDAGFTGHVICVDIIRPKLVGTYAKRIDFVCADLKEFCSLFIVNSLQDNQCVLIRMYFQVLFLWE